MRTTATPQEERPFARQIRAFVEAVNCGAGYAVDGEEGLKSLALTEAVLASIQSGEPIDL